ncbi:MAG: MarR family transcriptional regulator [bacterium]|nr:MarR family transcriptional regulator [bacterium]
MIGLIKKIKDARSQNTTYRVGLLQAKAFRILKQNTSSALSDLTGELKISTVEWALLGLLKDSKDGIRVSDLATNLGVEMPFITEMAPKLIKAGLISQTQSSKDKRVKIALLTPKGEAFVDKTEVHLRAKMKPLLEGASINEILGYLTVLQRIVKNSEESKLNKIKSD